MTEARKIEKLRIMFDTVPEAVLRQLRVALEFGAESDPDALPYGALLELIEEVANGRGLSLASPLVEAEPDQPEAQDTEPVEESEAQQGEPLVLQESVETLSEELASDEIELTDDFQPPRNAMHAFFGPFESLIIDPPKFQPRLDGYICSTSLPAIWRLLREEASGVVIRDAWIRAEVLPEPEGEAFYSQITEEMHLAAREVLDDLASRSREDPAVRRALISRLGSNAILGDLFEFQTLLPLGKSLQRAFARVKPMLAGFSDSAAIAISEVIIDEAQGNAAIAGYLQLSVVSYLAEPWRAVRLHQHLNGERMPGGGESCLIADHLIAYVTAQPDWLERQRLKGAFQPETVEALVSFSLMLGGLRQEFAALPDGELLGDRLKQPMKKGRSIFTGLLKRSLATIRAAMPVLDVEESEKAPDLDWLQRNREARNVIEIAHSAATFLALAGPAAAALGKKPLYQRARQKAAGEIDEYASSLLRMIQQSSAETPQNWHPMSEHLIELTGCLSGSEARTKAQDIFDTAAKAA